MRVLPEEIELDKNNLWYIDGDKVKVHKITLENPTFTFTPKSTFYKFDSTDDYIIKVDNRFLFFKEYSFKKMLYNLSLLKEKLPFIDIPIGYFKENNKLIGTIVPYYKNSFSINKIIHNYTLDSLSNIYNHDSNKENNLIDLHLEILNLLQVMFDNRLSYLDVHEGNFLIFNNNVKIIDFDPSYIKFNNSRINYHKIIDRYIHLINKINAYLNMNYININRVNNFSDVEKDIKKLIK